MKTEKTSGNQHVHESSANVYDYSLIQLECRKVVPLYLKNCEKVYEIVQKNVSLEKECSHRSMWFIHVIGWNCAVGGKNDF